MVTHYTVHVFIWGVFTADWWMVAIETSYCVNFLVVSCLGDKHIDIFFHVLFIFHNQISKVFRTDIKCAVVSLLFVEGFPQFCWTFFFMDFIVEMIHKIMFIKVWHKLCLLICISSQVIFLLNLLKSVANKY